MWTIGWGTLIIDALARRWIMASDFPRSGIGQESRSYTIIVILVAQYTPHFCTVSISDRRAFRAKLLFRSTPSSFDSESASCASCDSYLFLDRVDVQHYSRQGPQ